ncbi:hypothetical protein [Actinoplanes sp. L3-i22]|uniref:hypothetical protein n=1 Tax=Actinoplanes sp. L3-i22 TaxID=2836373 RepID=UPI001C781E54|nr:hypothetical protein [Actinoplanes sp. L3-i22]BCY10970.1 hypothetical protein L3i22_060580 [Actinoplanes sp. L3-i22]
MTSIAIHLSTAVQELLGPDNTRQVTGTSLAGGRCQDCRSPLPLHGPVNVVVWQDQDSVVIGFTHPDCGTSQVRLLPAGTLATAAPAAVPMQLAAVLQNHGSRALPVLAVQPVLQAMTATEVGGPADRNILVGALAAAGMTTDIDFVRAPEPLLSWPVTITPAGPGKATICVRMPSGHLLVDGVARLSPAWRDAANRHGRCVLYVGYGLWDPDIATPDAHSLNTQAKDVAGARLRLLGATRRG